MLYGLPDDGQKWPKLAVDDNGMCSILQVVFILDNKHRQCFHIHTNIATYFMAHLISIARSNLRVSLYPYKTSEVFNYILQNSILLVIS